MALRARSPGCLDGFSLEGFNKEQIRRNTTAKKISLCSLLDNPHPLEAPNVLSSSLSGDPGTNIDSKKDKQCELTLKS